MHKTARPGADGRSGRNVSDQVGQAHQQSNDSLTTSDKLLQRKAAFRSVDCADLDEYDQKLGRCVPRCIFACDEVAEPLDKTRTYKV